jgi:hypothetical protein
MCNFHAKCVIFTINLWIFRLFIKFQNSAGLKNSKISEFLSFQHFRCSCALARAKFGALARPFSLARAWELKNCNKKVSKKFAHFAHFLFYLQLRAAENGPFCRSGRNFVVLRARARPFAASRARARKRFRNFVKRFRNFEVFEVFEVFVNFGSIFGSHFESFLVSLKTVSLK